jgi:hypothetical protein
VAPGGSRTGVVRGPGTSHEGSGEYDNRGGPVGPWSLYLKQLRDRLGDAALHTIGY